MKRTIARALRITCFALLTTLTFSATNLSAAEKVAVKPATGTLSFIRLYTGPDGVSHWVDEKLQLASRGTEGIEALMATARVGDVKGAIVAMLKAGSTEDWHPAPRRQFMVCLRGLVEVTAGDGEKRRVKPGEFVLLEDTSGKGHVTHAAGTEDHVALALPVANDAFVRK
jgi:quercetin dioxygenase-like cupin family protein